MNLMGEISIMAIRTIRVGIDDAPPAPMQLGNPDAGDFRGYEVDLLEEIGRRVGFQLNFRRALWSVIIRELMAGDVDLVCSAATVTREREREVDFCAPHLRVVLAVVKRDGIAGDTAIKGLRVGVRRGTTAEAYAKQYGTPKPALVSESNEELYASTWVERQRGAIKSRSPMKSRGLGNPRNVPNASRTIRLASSSSLCLSRPTLMGRLVDIAFTSPVLTPRSH